MIFSNFCRCFTFALILAATGKTNSSTLFDFFFKILNRNYTVNTEEFPSKYEKTDILVHVDVIERC